MCPLPSPPDRLRPDAGSNLPIWDFAAQLLRDAPEEALQALPVDGAQRHHDLFGAPKRPGHAL